MFPSLPLGGPWSNNQRCIFYKSILKEQGFVKICYFICSENMGLGSNVYFLQIILQRYKESEKFRIFVCSYWLLSSYVLTKTCYCYCYCCANILDAIPASYNKGFGESVTPRLFVMKIITTWHCARHVCYQIITITKSPSKSSHHHHHVCLGGCSVTSCVTWHAGVSASPRHYYVTPTSPIFRPNPARCDSCFWTDGEC